MAGGTVVTTTEQMVEASERPSIRRWVTVYAVTRALLLAVAVVVAARTAGLDVLGALTAWDGEWYLRVVREGYGAPLPPAGATGPEAQHPLAFFPLFPLLARAADLVLPGGAAVAAVTVATLAGGIGVVLVGLLARDLLGQQVGDRAVVLMAAFPGAFVLSMAYSEGVLLACAAACLLALTRERWVVAGIAAALGSAARPSGAVLALACLWAAGVALRRGGHRWRPLVAPAMAPLGVMAYFGYLWMSTGEPLVWFRVQEAGWGEWWGLGGIPTGPLDLLGYAFIAVTTAFVLRSRLPGELWLWAYGSLAPVLLTGFRPRARFLLVAFPLLLPIADRVRGPVYWGLVALSMVGAAVLLALYAPGYPAFPTAP